MNCFPCNTYCHCRTLKFRCNQTRVGDTAGRGYGAPFPTSRLAGCMAGCRTFPWKLSRIYWQPFFHSWTSRSSGSGRIISSLNIIQLNTQVWRSTDWRRAGLQHLLQAPGPLTSPPSFFYWEAAMLSVELFLPSEEGWGKLNDGSIEINLTYSLQVPAGDTVALNTSYSSLWFSWSLPMLGRTGTGYTLVRPLWLYNVSLLPPPGPRNLDNIIAQSCVISEESYNCQWSILVFCTDFWLIAICSIIIAILPGKVT